MKLSGVMNVILLISTIAMVVIYFQDTSRLYLENEMLRDELKIFESGNENESKNEKGINKRDLFGRPILTHEEENLFEAQYKKTPACVKPINDEVMVKCVDDKRKNKYNWLQKQRSNVSVSSSAY